MKITTYYIIVPGDYDNLDSHMGTFYRFEEEARLDKENEDDIIYRVEVNSIAQR